MPGRLAPRTGGSAGGPGGAGRNRLIPATALALALTVALALLALTGSGRSLFDRSTISSDGIAHATGRAPRPVLGAAGAVRMGATMDPATNRPPDPNYAGICWHQGNAAAACDSAALEAINGAHQAEGIRPMVLPRGYASLSASEQVFVVTNLERVDRGLSPVIGLTAQLNADARTGAQHNTDPYFSGSTLAGSGSVGSWGSTWAADFNALTADYDWMYQDGWSGSAQSTYNVDCTGPGAAGCWGHRHVLLGGYGGGRLVGGAGHVAGGYQGYYDSDTELIASTYGGIPSLTYSWAQARSAGADAPPSAPTLRAVTPTVGPAAGGQQLHLVGTGFSAGLQVSVGGTPATAVRVLSDTTALVTTAARTAGAVQLAVSTGAGRATGLHYRFLAAPQVSRLSLRQDYTSGGATLLVTGTGFYPPSTSVRLLVGGATEPAAATVSGSTHLLVTVPPLPSGSSVAVLVSTPGGRATSSARIRGKSTAAALPEPVGRWHSVSPYLLTDTRTGSGQPGQGRPVLARQALDVAVSGTGGSSGVPARAAGAELTVTVLQPATNGALTLYPTGADRPGNTSLSFQAGASVTRTLHLPTGSTGQVTVYNDSGAAVQVVVRAEGYAALPTLTGPTLTGPTLTGPRQPPVLPASGAAGRLSSPLVPTPAVRIGTDTSLSGSLSAAPPGHSGASGRAGAAVQADVGLGG